MRKKILISSLLISALLTSCGNTTINTIYDVDRYEEYVNRLWRGCRYFMPSLDSFTDYKEISVSLTSSYHEHGDPDTEPYGLILFASYDEEIFDSKKDEINQTYNFIESPIKDKHGYNLAPAIDEIYCGYRIRVVYDEDFVYPKSFGMIGINDEKYAIAYMCYQDRELDYLGSKDEPIEETYWFTKSTLSKVFVFPEQMT